MQLSKSYYWQVKGQNIWIGIFNFNDCNEKTKFILISY